MHFPQKIKFDKYTLVIQTKNRGDFVENLVLAIPTILVPIVIAISIWFLKTPAVFKTVWGAIAYLLWPLAMAALLLAGFATQNNPLAAGSMLVWLMVFVAMVKRSVAVEE